MEHGIAEKCSDLKQALSEFLKKVKIIYVRAARKKKSKSTKEHLCIAGSPRVPRKSMVDPLDFLVPRFD